ncbi:GAF domain-containing protein [Deinococcus hohokamensis]|uniref:histidine kinase n=1 Tax=Deinococcus hohokamensis TaxID=309883 RepID=A0ABV9ICY9_9DEIO
MTEQRFQATVLNHIEDVVYVLDSEFRFSFLNAAAQRALHLTPEALGQALPEVLPGIESSEAYQRLQDAHRRQQAVRFEVLSTVMQQWISVDAYPADGGLIVCYRDIRERRQAEEHAAALAGISQGLATAVTARDAADVLVRIVPQAVGADVAVVALVDQQNPVLYTVAAHGLPEQVLAAWQTFPLESPVPLAAAVRGGRAVFTHSQDEAQQFYPAILEHASAHQATASLPLQFDGHTFGALGLSFLTPREFDPAEQTFLQAVAAQGAQAMERARLLDAERHAAERVAFLARAGELLAATLEPAEVLTQLATLTVPRLADCCIVFLPGKDGRLLPHAVAHHTPEQAEQIRAHLRRFPIDMAAPIGAAKAYREQTAEIIDLPSEELLRQAAQSDEHMAAVLDIGIRSVLEMPLVARGQALGVIEFMALSDARRYDGEDVVFAQELARRAALALDNAQLYQASQQAGEVLERTVQERTRELAARTDELGARTRALDAFALLSRDLAVETDRVKLIARAQEILTTLLPRGVLGYFEPVRNRWRLQCHSGDLQDEAFRSALLRGLDQGRTWPLDHPFETAQPLYLDRFEAPGQGMTPEVLAQLQSVAVFPVGTGSVPYGVLVVALYDQHSWTSTDRVLLETALSKVRLALQRAEAVDALAGRTKELEVLNAELDAFTSTVAHDLRAPLRHILTFSELLRRTVGPDLPERAHRHLAMIESSSARLNLLVEALLTFARTSRQPLHLGDVDLNVLVGEAAADLHLEMGTQPVDLQVGPLPTVRGDAVLLRQVLVNLLGNAVKYSSTRETSVVTVRAEETVSETILSVQDNGVGYDPRLADKLFDMFSRLHRADEYEGSGVGLATVKRVLQRHGGRVWSTSVPGSGATFFVALPKMSPGVEIHA